MELCEFKDFFSLYLKTITSEIRSLPLHAHAHMHMYTHINTHTHEDIYMHMHTQV